MSRKIKTQLKLLCIKILTLFLIIISISIFILMFLEANRYPRIVRSGYFRHPYLLLLASFARIYPGKGVSKEEILASAKLIYPDSNLYSERIYLSDKPTNDRSLRERYFSTACKTQVLTDEKIFYVVYKVNGYNDGILLYEYRTGKLVIGPGDW